MVTKLFSTLSPGQNGRNFADAFPMHFIEWKYMHFGKFSLNLVPKGLINNIPALVQIKAWRRPGDKPLFEPMLLCLPMHICVTWPQWFNINPTRTETRLLMLRSLWHQRLRYGQWVPKIVGYACAENAENVFPVIDVNGNSGLYYSGMHCRTCVTAIQQVAHVMTWSHTSHRENNGIL